MAMFEYEAMSIQGAVVKGRMDAVDKNAVIIELKGKNYFPVSVKPYKESKNVDISQYKRVPIKDIAIFCRQFSVILTAGISILKGLEIIKEQTENKKLKGIIGQVFDSVQKGKNLSESMGMHKDFPEMLVNMVQVGEASGTLDNIMDRTADYYDKENKLNRKIKQALTYPAMVSLFAVIVVIILVVKVLPTFVGIIVQAGGSNETLPLPTRIVLGISNAIQTRGLLILFVIIAAVVGLKLFFRRETGRNFADRFKLNMPIFGKIYRKIVTGRFARTFGTLMGSGIPLIESMTICSKVIGNTVVEKSLLATREGVKKGLGIGDTLSGSKIFPLMLTQMIKIGEESGTLDQILEKTADFYDGEVETATAQLTTMLEPLIIAVLGFVVGFIILSILLPMFEMYNAVGKM